MILLILDVYDWLYMKMFPVESQRGWRGKSSCQGKVVIESVSLNLSFIIQRHTVLQND